MYPVPMLYSDSSCATLVSAVSYKADACLSGSLKAVFSTDGSVSINTYSAASCAGDATTTDTFSRSDMSTTKCSPRDSYFGRFYTASTTDSINSAGFVAPESSNSAAVTTTSASVPKTESSNSAGFAALENGNSAALWSPYYSVLFALAGTALLA